MVDTLRRAAQRALRGSNYKDPMKLLISAYACAPHHGSDHAVGWNWITEAHRLGHTIWALVSPNHRDSITRACSERTDLNGINWVFPKVPGWPLKQAVEPKWERTYNLLWQAAAVGVARDLHAREGFDAIHHLTWAGIRAPTFLGSLGIPLIIGPVGGGETSPQCLRDKLGPRGRMLEWIRDISNSTITLNPVVRKGFRDAAVIFVSTSDTQKLFKGCFYNKSVVFSQLGLTELPRLRRRQRSVTPKFLYAGRLLYWKGVHIALRAFAELTSAGIDARFTIVGDGPERNRLEQETASLALRNWVEFIPRLPQAKLFELYDTHDLLLFPSLHDSGGFVVLEALSHGLPVVCLDLGGPSEIVTANSGVVVNTSGQNTEQLAISMAAGISQLLEAPEKMAKLSTGAIARAQEFILSARIATLYDHAVGFIKEGTCTSSASLRQH
jgi:glycosyltransferase involved in cell wall biosynthesis